jgi:hypothetical protein
VGFSRHACALALLFSTATLGWAGGAARAELAAQAGAARRSPLEALTRDARGADPAAARRAIEALAAHASPQADRALAELVHDGAADNVTDGVLEALAAHPRQGSFELLAELTQHRRAQARLRAVAALSKLEPGARGKAQARIAEALIRALGDSDTNVRGAAARALGERSERSGAALDALLRAIERGVPEAGGAAGRIAPDAELMRLHAALSTRPLTVVIDAYDALLARPSISEATKLDLIARLGELASEGAKAYLARLIAEKRFPKNSRLERATVDTHKRIAPPSAKGAP